MGIPSCGLSRRSWTWLLVSIGFYSILLQICLPTDPETPPIENAIVASNSPSDLLSLAQTKLQGNAFLAAPGFVAMTRPSHMHFVLIDSTPVWILETEWARRMIKYLERQLFPFLSRAVFNTMRKVQRV